MELYHYSLYAWCVWGCLYLCHVSYCLSVYWLQVALRIVLNVFLSVCVKAFFLRRPVSMYNFRTQVKNYFRTGAYWHLISAELECVMFHKISWCTTLNWFCMRCSVSETCLLHRKCKWLEALWSVCTVELWVCGKRLWNLFSRINYFQGWCVCAKVSEFYLHHIQIERNIQRKKTWVLNWNVAWHRWNLAMFHFSQCVLKQDIADDPQMFCDQSFYSKNVGCDGVVSHQHVFFSEKPNITTSWWVISFVLC